MSESNMSATMMKAIKVLHPKRIENKIEKGTPDVNFADGWIENKWAARWPPRGGRLKLEHYQPDQRIFQLKRGRAGGNIHLLLCVGQEWFLLGWEYAADEFYKVGCTRQEAIDNCERCWLDGLVGEELVEVLKMADDYVVLDADFIRESEKAILVKNASGQEVWVPKSQCRNIDGKIGGSVSFEMREWLCDEKDLHA